MPSFEMPCLLGRRNLATEKKKGGGGGCTAPTWCQFPQKPGLNLLMLEPVLVLLASTTFEPLLRRCATTSSHTSMKEVMRTTFIKNPHACHPVNFTASR